MTPYRFSHILVPVDGSDGAKKALDAGLSLCEAMGCRLTALAVEGRLPAFAGSIGEVEEVKREKDRYFSGVLEEARSAAAARGIEIEADLVSGHAAEVITHYARTHGHDLIADGARRGELTVHVTVKAPSASHR